MRKSKKSRVLFSVAAISIFGAGLTMAATPVSAQESQMLCMFPNVNCLSSDCADLCNMYYRDSTPYCQISNGCCNCLY